MSIKAMTYVWEHSEQQGTALLCLLALADYANDEGIAYPGMTALAKRCRLKDKKGLKRILDKLAQDGEITIEVGAGMRTRYGPTNRYMLNGYRQSIGICRVRRGVAQPPQQGVTEPPLTQQGVTEPPPEGVAQPPQQGVTEPPKPSIDPPIEPSIGRERTQTAAAPIDLDGKHNFDRTKPLGNIPYVERSESVKRARRQNPRRASPHYDLKKFTKTGYIPIGAGETCVEVYYERNSIDDKDARLTEPQEDILSSRCGDDLSRLRQVIETYDNCNFQRKRNLQLIFDWFEKGIPAKYTSTNGATNGQQQGASVHRKSYQNGVPRPHYADYVAPEWDEQRAAELNGWA